jgi:hypothetical protein
MTSATFSGAPGHSYAFRVRATDALGNGSAFVACGPTTVGFAAVPPAAPLSPVGQPLPASPHLSLSKARRSHGRLVIAGHLASRATGRVSWTFTTHGHRALRGHVAISHGRFRFVIRVPGRSRRQSGLLRVQYSGDHSYAPQRIARRIR